MNRLSNKQAISTRGRALAGMAILLLSGLLAGCSKPNDEEMSRLLAEAYACKGIETAEMTKTDSLPGIYSYVGKYSFQVRLVGGEKGALEFYRHLLNLADVKNNDWKSASNSPKVKDYLEDECAEAIQPVMDAMFEDLLEQLATNKPKVRLPLMMPMTGWSEFMPGKKGWDMTMRRDKLGEDIVYSEPIKRELLLSKKAGKATKGKKK
ncbi:MAG: hypothetical protein VB032_06770 [Burkholderiaceae bacterium]|nr:hypothetical protein [Burkholderiaceae bacterium]